MKKIILIFISFYFIQSIFGAIGNKKVIIQPNNFLINYLSLFNNYDLPNSKVTLENKNDLIKINTTSNGSSIISFDDSLYKPIKLYFEDKINNILIVENNKTISFDLLFNQTNQQYYLNSNNNNYITLYKELQQIKSLSKFKSIIGDINIKINNSVAILNNLNKLPIKLDNGNFENIYKSISHQIIKNLKPSLYNENENNLYGYNDFENKPEQTQTLSFLKGFLNFLQISIKKNSHTKPQPNSSFLYNENANVFYDLKNLISSITSFFYDLYELEGFKESSVSFLIDVLSNNENVYDFKTYFVELLNAANNDKKPIIYQSLNSNYLCFFESCQFIAPKTSSLESNSTSAQSKTTDISSRASIGVLEDQVNTIQSLLSDVEVGNPKTIPFYSLYDYVYTYSDTNYDDFIQNARVDSSHTKDSKNRCIFQDSKNRFFDLSPSSNVLKSSQYTTTNGSNIFYFSLCETSTLCNATAGEGPIQSCVSVNGTRYPTGITLFSHVQFFDNGLTIQYQSGKIDNTKCTNQTGYHRISNFILTCDTTQNYAIKGFVESSPCVYDVKISTKFACPIENKYLFGGNQYDLRSLKLASSSNPYMSAPELNRFLFNLGGGTVDVCNKFSGLSGKYYGCLILGLGKTTIPFFDKPTVSKVPFIASSNTSNNILISFSSSSTPTICTTKPDIKIYIRCSNTEFTVLTTVNNSICNQTIYASSKNACPLANYEYFGSNPSSDSTFYAQVFDFSPLQNRTINGSIEYIGLSIGNVDSSYYHNFGIQPNACPADKFACQILNSNKNTYPLGKTQYYQYSANILSIKSYGLATHNDCPSSGYKRTLQLSLTCNKTENYKVTSYSENPMCTYNLNVQSKYACQQTVSALYHNVLLDNYIDLRPLKTISSGNYQYKFGYDTIYFNMGGSTLQCMISGVAYQSCINLTVPFGSIGSQQFIYHPSGIDIMHTYNSNPIRKLTLQFRCNTLYPFRIYTVSKSTTEISFYIETTHACTKTFSQIYPNSPALKNPCEYTCRTPQRAYTVNSITHVLLSGGVCGGEFQSNYTDIQLSTLFSQYWYDNKIPSDWTTGQFYNLLFTNSTITKQILSKFVTKTNNNYCSYISYTSKFKTFSSILDQSIDLRKFSNQSIHRQVNGSLTVTHTPHPTNTAALGLTIISINNKTCAFLETTLANAFTTETIRNCPTRDYCRYNCTGITQSDLNLLNTKNDLNSTLLTIGVCPNELLKYNTTTFSKVIKFFEKRWIDNPTVGNWRSGQFYEYLKLTNVVSKINILSKYVDQTTSHYLCTYTSTEVKPKNSFEDIRQITFDLFKLALKNNSTRKSYTNFDTYFAPSTTNPSFGLSMVFVNYKICSFVESSIQDFQSGKIITSCPIGPIVDDVVVKLQEITVNARFCPTSTNTLFAYVGSSQASFNSIQRYTNETCRIIFRLSSLTMSLQNKRVKIYNEYSKNIYESLYQRNILYYFKFPVPTVTKITYPAANPKYNSLITVTGENFFQALDSINGLVVKIGEKNATITSFSNTRLYINAIGAGFNYISFYYFNNLKMNIKSDVINYFTFENAIISSLSKTSGNIGDVVTVNGQNFFNGSTKIYFGLEIAEIKKFTSDKIIEVIVPPGFYSVDIFVFNTGMNASTTSLKFTYPSMIIDKVYYDDKHLNTSIVNKYWIVGRGLGSIVEQIPEATVDNIDSFCEIQRCLSDEIANSKIDYSNICPYLKSQYAYYSTNFDLYLCSFPINVGASRTIQVTLPNNAKYTYKYSYSLPWLSEYLTANSSDTHGGNCSRSNCVTPPQKPQYLNITGFNFNPFEFISPFYDLNKTIASWKNSSRIYIGTFECGSVQWINSTNVSCIIPPGIGANLKVNITIGEQKSENQLLFSYNKPNITNKISVSTDGATDIKYVGFNFVPAELKDFYNKEENKNVSVNSITINGKTQYKDIKWINSTSFSFNPVAGIGKNHSVVLLVGGQKSNETRSFSYNPPSLDNKQYSAPSSGGKTITIKGLNFVPKSLVNSVNSSNGTVSINGILCVKWEWVDSKNVKCTVPPGKGKGLPIRVNVQSQLNNLNNYFSYYDPESPTNIVIFMVIGLAALVAAALLASTALPLTQIALATSATAAKSGSILASTASFSGALEKSLQFGFAAVTRRVVTQVAKDGIKRVSTIALAMVVTKSSISGGLLSSSTAPVPTSNLLSIASTPYSAVFFSINHNDRIFTIDNQFNETVTCIDNNNLSVNFNKSFTCQINSNNNGIKCNTTNFGTEINCGVRSKSASYKFSVPTVSKVSSSLKCEYDANEKSMIIYGQNSPIYCKDGFNEYTYNHNSTIFCSNSETQSNIVECVSDGGEPEHSFINNVECYNYNKYSSCSKNSLVKASDYSACFEVPPSEAEPIVITNQTIITEFNSASSKLACYPKEVEFNYAYNNTLICYNVKSGTIDYSDSILHQVQHKVKVCIEKE
ncbi:hypothetical protein ACTFIZ_012028 [Dictyostelium cf. discoideum]